MKYTKVLVARVALRVATEDEVFWINQCIQEDCGCESDIKVLREIDAANPSSLYCGKDADLILTASSNKISLSDEEHFNSCQRCARIGQYIANMADPSATEVTSMELLAG